MTKIKSYIDLDQSKKLADILPVDSADMYYPNRKYIDCDYALPIKVKRGAPLLSQEIPCWSLAALLDVLPKTIDNHYIQIEISTTNEWIVLCQNLDRDVFLQTFGNIVDACYEMIQKLHEQNLL